MMTRDPRVDPKPGDEVAGPVIKSKVVSVTTTEAGIAVVEYTVAAKSLEYHPEHTAKVSLEHWSQFAGCGEVLHVAQAGAR
jgi:hypothetical protein